MNFIDTLEGDDRYRRRAINDLRKQRRIVKKLLENPPVWMAELDFSDISVWGSTISVKISGDMYTVKELQRLTGAFFHRAVNDYSGAITFEARVSWFKNYVFVVTIAGDLRLAPGCTLVAETTTQEVTRYRVECSS